MSPDTFRTSPVEQAPAVPFSGHINEGLRVGERLIVVGVVEPRPDRFYILLSCGPGLGQRPPSDVALELCVLMKESQVLCRARVSGRWGAAERTAPFFPFIHQPFRIDISCQQSQFQIFVDGQQLLSFGHRVPRLQDIDTLWIAGALRITKLG
ncbi:galectin-related protein [Gadus macrocephalus]|uniref:galectin-related protein n=1 Tax=Gadus macrocephalus TaxID=80720 RepID=UPI0028CB6E5C|nr:galectin-related protein [Gadus macrocephalus]